MMNTVNPIIIFWYSIIWDLSELLQSHSSPLPSCEDVTDGTLVGISVLCTNKGFVVGCNDIHNGDLVGLGLGNLVGDIVGFAVGLDVVGTVVGKEVIGKIIG